MVSHETLDGSSFPSGILVRPPDAFLHKEDGKPSSLMVEPTDSDKKEKIMDGSSVDVTSSAGIEHSRVGSKIVSAANEKDVCCDPVGEKQPETTIQALPMVEISNVATQNEPQKIIADKDDEELELEVCPILIESTVKESDTEAIKISEEVPTKESVDEPSLKASGEICFHVFSSSSH